MFSTLIDRVTMLLATGLGFGYSPWAPGTVGSLWGPILVWWMQSAGLTGVGWFVTSLIIALIGVPICKRAASILGVKDPGSVVWDEIAAFPLVFAFTQVTPATAFLGFVCFRVFDIAKPWPIRRFERLPGGWGIMADDLVAAVFACGCLVLLDRFVVLT
ncbi:MAG: phosphatidylglycerophosphatase A [Planctomycetaceae bacterium]|nr:phosphatidylglycerophosphatase A [Planctomycetaceae bacterium]